MIRTYLHHQRGNSLILILVFLAVLSVGLATALRQSSNTMISSRLSSEQAALKPVIEDLMEGIRLNIMRSADFLSGSYALMSQNQAQWNSFWNSYTNDYSNFIQNNSIDDYFVDYARNEGYRSQEIAWENGISYQYSVRCIKDESLRGQEGYTNGRYDSCPTLPRAEWTSVWLEEAVYPKLEVILTLKRENGERITIREIGEVQPFQLADFCFVADSVTNFPYGFKAGNYYGRVHFDQSSPADPGNNRLNFDASQGSINFLRPFTTSGLRADIIDHLEGNPPLPASIPGVFPNPVPGRGITFVQGYKTNLAKINLLSVINSSLVRAQEISVDGSGDVIPISGSNCLLTPSNGMDSVVISGCVGGGDGTYPLSDDAVPTTFYFSNSVNIGAGFIKNSLAVYSAQNIVFRGPVNYSLAEPTAPSHISKGVFVPYVKGNPLEGDPNPFEILARTSDGGPVVEGIKSPIDPAAPIALWVAGGNIHIEMTAFVPLKAQVAAHNGMFYTEGTAGSVLDLLGLASAVKLFDNDASNAERQSLATNAARFHHRLSIIDGKMQTLGTIRLVRNGSTTGTFNWNYRTLILRGGIAVGTAPIMRQNLGAFNVGFNNVLYLFDPRSKFNRVPGQTSIAGQSRWQLISMEFNPGVDLKGKLDSDLAPAVP